MQDIDLQEAMKRLEKHFGSREGVLIHTLTKLSMTQQPTDVTFYRRKPMINVRVSAKLGAVRIYGLDRRFADLLNSIEFSNGLIAGLSEIWTIHPMPKEGFTTQELATADLSEGDRRAGPQGETIRKMIRKTYHCKSQKETEYFLRRFILS